MRGSQRQASGARSDVEGRKALLRLDHEPWRLSVRAGTAGAYLVSEWSGRLDSNQRSPAPKAGAIPGFATPRSGFHSIPATVRMGVVAPAR